jgi:hypothetical protein
MAHRNLVPDVVILDDESTREGVRRSLDRVSGADLLVGPYGSDLVAEAARWAADRGRALWNHGGNADDVQLLPGVVSVGTPASRYLSSVLDVVATELPEARVMVAVGRGAFGRSVAHGAREAAERLGMTIVGIATHGEVPEEPNADALLMAGTFAEDLELVRRLRARPPAIGAVAAGLGMFGAELGRMVEGILGPSQWEEGLRFPIDVGPRQAEVVRSLRASVFPTLRAGARAGHVEYPTAQAYATGLLAMHCVEEAAGVGDDHLLATARVLRCTTFFGAFGLDADGRLGKPAGNSGDEVGELDSSVTTGVDLPDLHELPSRAASGECSRNVGDAFRGQRGLFVVRHGDDFGMGSPEVDCSGQCRNQRLK